MARYQRSTSTFATLVSPMNVLLVRNPSEDAPDRYHQHLQSIGLHPHSVPVLETVFTNLGDLYGMVEGKSPTYGGVIMTSSRAAECWDLVRGKLSRGGLTSSGEQFRSCMGEARALN